MTTVFVVCALIGGTILVFQFVLTMIGLGGEAFDLDLPDGDVDLDVGGDVDIGHDAHVDSSWLFGVISFRTIVAALAFFGLAGLAAQQADARPATALIVAIAAGIVAMYVVYWVMRGLASMKTDGTLRIQRAVGKHATVYIPIPASEGGAGKIQMSLQSQTAEYLAMTAGQALPSGSKVVVVGVITPTTVEVEPVLETERNNHV